MQLVPSDKLIYLFGQDKNKTIRFALKYRFIGGLSNIYSREGMVFGCLKVI